LYFGQSTLQRLERVITKRVDIDVRQRRDPLAQSFVVERPVILTEAWIWVHRVPPPGFEYGLEVGVRNMTEGGLPGNSVFGRGFVSKSQIMNMMGISHPSQVITTPTFANAVRVRFEDPIYLEPGYYCLYVGSQGHGYEVFTARGRKIVLGNLADPSWEKIGKSLDRQVHEGMLFKSYNFLSWEIDMERDLMFRLMKAVFDTNVVGEIKLGVSGIDFPIHEFQYGVAHVVPTGAVLSSEYSVGAGWKQFEMVNFDEERARDDLNIENVGSEAEQLKFRLLLRTQNRDVAPIVFRDFGFVQVWTYVDSGEYYTKEVRTSLNFSYFKLWIEEQANNGTVVYKVSFDSGVSWYQLPLVSSILLREGWIEKELGGSLDVITGGSLSEADRFIIKVEMSSGVSSRWMTPKISSLRALVY